MKFRPLTQLEDRVMQRIASGEPVRTRFERAALGRLQKMGLADVVFRDADEGQFDHSGWEWRLTENGRRVLDGLNPVGVGRG